MSGIWYVVGSVVFNVIGQFLLKSGVAKVALTSVSAGVIVRTILTPLVFAGFVCYAVSSIFWILALSKQDLSTAYPILLGLGLVSVVVVSWIFLNEGITTFKFIGVLLIALGIYFVMKAA